MQLDDSQSDLTFNPPSKQALAALEEYLAICQSGSAAELDSWTIAHQNRLHELSPFIEVLQELWSVSQDEVSGSLNSERTLPDGIDLSASSTSSEPPTGGYLSLGEFRLLSLIGRGGMGVIYLAEQPALRRKVAVKILQPAALLDKTFQRRFEIESQAAAKLHHPHIVQVFTVGCEAGIHYYAMQLIEGENLAAWIERLRSDGGPAGQLPKQVTDSSWFRTVAKIGHDAADALSYAHQKGLIHRDIKPSNLLIDGNGQVFVADFGLACSHEANNLTVTGQLLGTLRYASREQVLGDRAKIDHRTDIYSLGVSLYEMLTLQPPFEDTSRAALTHAVLNRQPIKPRSINPAIPVELEAVVLKAISSDLETRYATAAELRDDLDRFLNGRPVLARRPTLTYRCLRIVSRNPKVVASLLLSLSLLVMLLLITTSYVLHAKSQTLQSKELAEQKSVEIGQLQKLTEEQLKVALQQEVALRRMQYDNNLAVANLLIQRSDLFNADQALDREEPQDALHDQRGLDWHFAKQICDTRYPHFKGHTKEVYCTEWSHNGELLATSSQDKSIRLWRPLLPRDDTNFYGRQTSPGKLERVLTGHSDEVNFICFSADDRWLASASDDQTVRIWDRANDWQSFELGAHNDKVVGVAFSPDARYVFSTDNSGVLIVWDREVREPVQTIKAHQGRIQSIVHSPTRNLLSTSADDSNVRIWDTSALPQLTEFACIDDFTWGIFAVAWSPTGDSIAMGGAEAIIRTWRVSEPDKTEYLSTALHQVQSLNYSPDGNTLLAVTNWPVVEVIDAQSGRRVASYPFNSQRLWCCRYAPEGRYLAVTGSMPDVALIDSQKTERLADMVTLCDDSHESIAWSDDGKWLVCRTKENRLELRRGDDGALVERFPDDEAIEDFEFTSNHSLLTGGKVTRHWEIEPSLKCITTFPQWNGTFWLSGDRQYISCSSGTLWSIPEQRFVKHWWPDSSGGGLSAFFPDHDMVLVARGGQWRWQPLPAGQPTDFEFGFGFGNAVFTKDSIITSISGLVRRVRVNETRPSGLPFGIANSITDMQVTQDQSTLVTAGNDGMLRFFSIYTHQELLAIPFPAERLTAVAVSKVDRRVVVSSFDDQGHGKLRFLTIDR